MNRRLTAESIISEAMLKGAKLSGLLVQPSQQQLYSQVHPLGYLKTHQLLFALKS